MLAELAIGLTMMKRRNLQFTLFFLYCIDRCTAVNKCYYPGGGESLDDAPCDPDAEVSVCCGRFSSGGGCLSNKLCMGIDGRMSRGSCTDKNWLSPECPNFCTVLRQGIVVTPCLNGNDSSTTHCCFLDRICCSDESALFEAPPARPVTTATWNSKSFRYISFQLQPSTSSSSTKTSTSSLSTAPLTSTSTESTAMTASRSITTTEPASSTTTPESTSSPPGNQPQSQPQPQQQQQQPGLLPPATTAGIAIGAILGAALIAAVVYLLWRLNKSQKLLEQAVAGNQAPGNTPHYSPPYGFYHSSQHSHTPETNSVKELPSDRSAGELYAGPLPEGYSFAQRPS
ncbi:hypothetical protein QC762_104320 [Podospora pseudocomata]|uniref:Mid2 domain-containing protein n=1 Tax=Podospora pseudocomata TaxID=2093779 RepID=A0ABR0GSM3_9PEZI|nr:hypothetical protein QC762_104320 [Podospora pseudocomata]